MRIGKGQHENLIMQMAKDMIWTRRSRERIKKRGKGNEVRKLDSDETGNLSYHHQTYNIPKRLPDTGLILILSNHPDWPPAKRRIYAWLWRIWPFFAFSKLQLQGFNISVWYHLMLTKPSWDSLSNPNLRRQRPRSWQPGRREEERRVVESRR